MGGDPAAGDPAVAGHFYQGLRDPRCADGLAWRERLQQHFQIERGAVATLQPRYNIAPAQPVLAVVAAEALADKGSGRRAVHFRWGLIPRWSQAPKAGLINARSETVAQKPSFCEAFRRRRCLIPADGFYEWVGQGKQGRQPYWFYLLDRPLTLPPPKGGGFLRSPQKNP